MDKNKWSTAKEQAKTRSNPRTESLMGPDAPHCYCRDSSIPSERILPKGRITDRLDRLPRRDPTIIWLWLAAQPFSFFSGVRYGEIPIELFSPCSYLAADHR
jgi:hypothetical protein